MASCCYIAKAVSQVSQITDMTCKCTMVTDTCLVQIDLITAAS